MFSVGNSCFYDNKFLFEFPMLKAGEALKERQARYVNVQGSVHQCSLYDFGKCTIAGASAKLVANV